RELLLHTRERVADDLGRRRRLRAIALGHPGLLPRRDRVDLLVRETCVVLPAMGRLALLVFLGAPRRHRPGPRRLDHRADHGARLLVGLERERREAALGVTALARALNDRLDILVERRLVSHAEVAPTGATEKRRRRQQDR